MEKLLTVVIPAYNARAYLKRCLCSFLRIGEMAGNAEPAGNGEAMGAATVNGAAVAAVSGLTESGKDGAAVVSTEGPWDPLAELELLVVDDGSTDGTGALADAFAARYPATVRVIHKENGGHGSGINCGIREALGKYFKVVDADDWVDGKAFLRLLHCLRQADSDAVVSGFYWVFERTGRNGERRFFRKAEMKRPFRGVEYGRNYRFDEIAGKIYVKMHGLTIRTDILRDRGIRMDEHCFYVDTEYSLYPIPYVNTICFTEDFVYQYRIGREGQSVSLEKMRENRGHYDRVLQSLLLFYDQCRKGEILCSEQKLGYLARGIARVAAGKIKILLSYPAGKERKQELLDMDQGLRKQYPRIYRANQSRPVWLLRLSRFALYRLAVLALAARGRRV